MAAFVGEHLLAGQTPLSTASSLSLPDSQSLFASIHQTYSSSSYLLISSPYTSAGFLMALIRVFRNWIVVSLMLADHALSFSSYPDGTYASKYLQYEFHLSAADASAIRGILFEFHFRLLAAYTLRRKTNEQVYAGNPPMAPHSGRYDIQLRCTSQSNAHLVPSRILR